MALLQRRLFYLIPSSIACKTTRFSSPHHLLFTLLHFSTTTIRNPSPNPPFMVEYLINSCGLSSDMAVQASKHLSHLKSPSNPNSVLHFLQQNGFSGAHIAKLITLHPRFLCTRVEKNLRPKFKALREMGFFESDVILLVLGCPKIFWYGDLQPKIEFWRRIFGSKESLLKVLKRDPLCLLSSSLGKKIMPKIALLRDCGIPDSRIEKILTSARFIGLSLDSVKAYIERAENLEVPRSSRMFWQAFVAVVCHSKATVDAKFRLYKSLGWSEAEASSAISKTPKLLHLSDKVIYEKMDFLMKEVGCKASYIARRPALLTYSLERRLISRNHVLRILKKNNVPEGEQDFFAAVMVPEVKFLNKYVLPHMEKIPGIHEAYVVACAGNVTN